MEPTALIEQVRSIVPQAPNTDHPTERLLTFLDWQVSNDPQYEDFMHNGEQERYLTSNRIEVTLYFAIHENNVLRFNRAVNGHPALFQDRQGFTINKNGRTIVCHSMILNRVEANLPEFQKVIPKNQIPAHHYVVALTFRVVDDGLPIKSLP